MPKESSHFSLAAGHTFHLLGYEKCQKKSSHISLAGSKNFHLQGVWKMPKKVRTSHMQGSQFSLAGITLFICSGLKKAKWKFALFTCSGLKKCQKKVRPFHLQGVTLITYRRSKKIPKESSHFSLAGSLKKMLAFFGPHASEKFSVDIDDKHGGIGAAY